jgi:molybdopterin-binding protein
MKVSARNVLPGTVKATYAIIKAPNVMIGVD